MSVASVLEQFPVASHQRVPERPRRRYENAVGRITGRRSR